MSELNKVQEPEEVIGELIHVDFPMYEKPAGVQYTIHVNNLLATYPKQKKQIIKQFKDICKTDKISGLEHLRVRQIVEHYGINYTKQWFKDIYGWNFNVKKEAI